MDPHDHRAARLDPGGDQAMKTVLASLADNKAALGRRYAEWAVSAPTLESAVAAAAMAQDELGHARSTYPVLKGLGVEANEDGFGGDKRLGLLDDELPDWNAFIAANLLVDGVLTTFVASCVDSSLDADGRSARRRSSRRRARTARTARPGRGGCCAAIRSRRVRRAAAGDVGARGPLDRARRRRGDRGRRRGRRGVTRRGRAARAGARVARRRAGRRRRRSSPCPSSPGTAGTPSGAGGRHELPVLRLGRRRARRPVGRPDHHRAVALRRVQLVLRSQSATDLQRQPDQRADDERDAERHAEQPLPAREPPGAA